MPQDSKYIPLAARETLTSSDQENDSGSGNLSSTDVCTYPLSTTSTWDSKGASSSCILRPPKSKEDLASTFKCIYPLSSMEEQTLDMFADKHASESTKFDTQALMVIINNMFHHSNSESKCLQDPGSKVTGDILPPENIRDIINQIRFDCDSEGGLRGTSFHILDVVMEYSWEAKLVLIMSALVTSYGKFCFEMIHQTAINPFDWQKHPFQPTRETISSNLTRLSNLVKNILEVGTVILQFKPDRDQQNAADIEPKINKVFHSVILQIIKVWSACSSYMELAYADIKNITLDTEIKRQDYFLKELLENRKNVTDILSTIDREGADNYTPIEYRDIKILITKLYTEEKTLSGEMTIQIVLDGLKGYTTGLLISDVNTSIENFKSLIQTYEKIPKERKFRIVWFPLADQSLEWTDAEEKAFCKMASFMPWCCCHPSMVIKAFCTHFARQFKIGPALVVLNDQAEVITYNALPVVQIWGAKAYPFSSDMVATISNNWTLMSMIEDWEIDGLDWENDIVCIYGGDNLELTRSYSQYVQRMSNSKSNIQIKAIYVGTNGEKENLQKIVSSLEQMNVKCLSMSLMSSLWTRLAIILNNALDNPIVMKQLPALLCYSKEELWTTMLYKGSTELIKPTGTQLVKCFEEFIETKKEHDTTDEFWKCLIQITKPENLISSAVSASACGRVRNLFGGEHQDVSEVLAKVFIKETGIFEGQTGLEHFKGKSVGFLVTKMDAKIEEVTALLEKHKQIHQGPDFKIIWIPIMETTGQLTEKSLSEKALSMGWYYCEKSMFTKDFSTYIRQDYYFETRSSLMVLNKHGKVDSTLQWDAATFPWEYRVMKEPQSNWSQYKSGKELEILFMRFNEHFKYSTVYDVICDAPVDVLEIFAPCIYRVTYQSNVKLAPNTVYEMIYLVMLTEEAHGWESPLYYRHSVLNNSFIHGSVLINDKPRGVWFEIKVAEFSLLPGKINGVLQCDLFDNTGKHKGIMIKGAGIRENKR